MPLSAKNHILNQIDGQPQGLSLRLCVIIGLRFFVLQKDCKGSNPINNSQKIKGTANAIPFIYDGEQGIFRRTAVRLRIASLFNHGLSNSPPDCFHRQSRPSLFESLAVLSTKKQRVQQTLYPLFLAESKGLGSLRSPKSLLRKLSYYRLLLTRLRLAKDCKGSNPFNNSQKIKGTANAIPFIYGGEQGIFSAYCRTPSHRFAL